MLVLSHFKGHFNGGFGGALKNISIGVASAFGKARIHTAGKGDDINSPFWLRWNNEKHDDFLSSMADAAASVSDYFGHGERMLYISVMNNLSVDCDCDSSPAKPEMHDIGILASTDPVALDQACVDLVYASKGSAALIERMESRNGVHILECAEKLGLGSRSYRIVEL